MIKELEKHKFVTEFKGATIADLDWDDELGVFKMTLGDGRLLILFQGGSLIHKSEEAYQKMRQRYLAERKDLMVDEAMVDEAVDEVLAKMGRLKGKENKTKKEVVN